jgi:hypothetical protein
LDDEASKNISPETAALLQRLALANQEVEQGKLHPLEEAREHFQKLAKKRGQ